MQMKLYPGTLTPAQYAAGDGSICGLPFAVSPTVEQTINGDWSLTFEYPLRVAGAAQLALGRLVEADGQLYRIEDCERSTKNSGRLHVRALHLMYDLRDKFIVNIETSELTPGGINQRTALQQVLNGTDFTDGTIDTPILLDYLDILQKNALWAVKEQVLPLWGGELKPDNWAINILAQMGANRGVQLRYGKNLTGIKYTESLDGVVTRLHIVGYQGANIESINGGLDYIDSANIGAYPTIREGIVTFSDDDLPEDLLSKGQAYLATVDTPRIKLSVDLAAIRGSEQYKHYTDLEEVELGDTVTVYHKDLGINITARVQSRSYNPVTGDNLKITLGNDDRNLYSTIASAQQAAEIVRMITDRNSHVRGENLRGVIDLLTTQLMASGSFTNAEVRDNQGALFENTDPTSVDFGALYIGPGIFAIANTKDEAGSWIWRTFGTGQGFVGTEIIAQSITTNQLAAEVGESLDLSSNIAITSLVSSVSGGWVDVTTEALVLELAALGAAEAIADGVITVFMRDDEPTVASLGDVWLDTDDSNAPYTWDGSAWVAYAGELAELTLLASHNMTLFYQASAPTSLAVGDLWYALGASPANVYVAKSAGATEIENGLTFTVTQTVDGLALAQTKVSALEDAAARTNSFITLGTLIDSDSNERTGLAIGENLLDENGNILQERTAVRIFSDRQSFYQNGEVALELKDGGITAGHGNFGHTTVGGKWRTNVDSNGTYAVTWVG